jgi:hypothetical protein
MTNELERVYQAKVDDLCAEISDLKESVTRWMNEAAEWRDRYYKLASPTESYLVFENVQ